MGGPTHVHMHTCICTCIDMNKSIAIQIVQSCVPYPSHLPEIAFVPAAVDGASLPDPRGLNIVQGEGVKGNF